MNRCYEIVKEFMRKYPLTMAWRIKAHSKVVESHLCNDEEILYAFPGQYNIGVFDFFNTYLIVFTSKRIILASKRVLFGYFYKSITPDMYNDLTVNKNIFWGRVIIDTIKEVINITNIDAKALPEIDKEVNAIVLKQKKELGIEIPKEEVIKSR